jgi:curved DNA-binding protein CbpA
VALDPYELLGVPADASLRQIRRRFLALAERHRKDMLVHPAAYRDFEKVNAAYHLL